MRVAVIGSRTLHIENLKDYLPDDTTEIVSGGAKGVDADAKEYATQNQIPITEFLPDYQRYGRGAPLKAQYSNHRLCRYCAGGLGW